MSDTPEPLPLSAYLTTTQIGDAIGITSLRVNQWIVSGIKTKAGRVRLVAVKLGGHWRVHPAVAADFMKLPQVVAAAEAWKLGVAQRNAEREANRRAGQ